MGVCAAPFENATRMPGVKSDKDTIYSIDARHLGAIRTDRARQSGGTVVSSGPQHFRKPWRGLDAAQHAWIRSRDPLGAAPGAKPEIRSLDEAIQCGRQ